MSKDVCQGGYMIPGIDLSETGITGGSTVLLGRPNRSLDGLKWSSERPFEPQRRPKRTVILDGRFAQRKLSIEPREYCLWDSRLIGFGMRVRPSGKRTWFVRLRQRGKQVRVSLGNVGEVDAATARAEAQRRLKAAALDGLPKRKVVKRSPELQVYFAEFWKDCARNWKPSTQQRNLQAWRGEILPQFGTVPVAEITSKDVERWRDDYAGSREGVYNRTIPVFSAIMAYAELLGHRAKGSNPCRGMPRYKRRAKERFLSPAEYRRLGKVLRAKQERYPFQVAIVRLLLLTGARCSEITDLRWEWVKPPRLDLPDSKTGPKIILLNSQALDVLNALPRAGETDLVFPSRRPDVPVDFSPWWARLRRECGLPDVRIHDLRHSFASTAIMANVPLGTVGRLLGHSHPESTAKYAHLADDVVADAATRVSNKLARKLGLIA